MVDPFLSVKQTRILHIMPQRQMRTAASAKNPAQALDLTAREWCIPLPGPMKKSGKPADDGIFTAIARVPVRQCASERPQMQNGAQAVGHNDGVPVQQCASEVLQMQNGAQALDPTARKWYIILPEHFVRNISSGEQEKTSVKSQKNQFTQKLLVHT